MKFTHIIMILFIVLLLASCASAELSYELSEQNTVELNYKVELNSGDQDLNGYVQTITSYWNNLDFETQTQSEEGLVRITGTRTIKSDTKNLAAENFVSILGGEDSFFENIQFKYIPSYEVDEYDLKAIVDLRDVIRQSEVQNIPDDELSMLISGAKDGNYTLSISLPGEVVSTNADSTDNGICTWQLHYGESTEIKLHNSLRNDENISVYTGLKHDLNQSNTLFLICCIIACVCVLAFIVYFAVRRYIHVRASKVRVKKFR